MDTSGNTLLARARVAARLPAQDLEGARRFCAERLGLEPVDVPGFKTRDGIAEIEGNYPSKGARGERGAWFRDSEGNLIGIGEPVV
jgi:hypothetical protein